MTKSHSSPSSRWQLVTNEHLSHFIGWMKHKTTKGEKKEGTDTKRANLTCTVKL